MKVTLTSRLSSFCESIFVTVICEEHKKMYSNLVQLSDVVSDELIRFLVAKGHSHLVFL